MRPSRPGVSFVLREESGVYQPVNRAVNGYPAGPLDFAKTYNQL